MRRFCNQEAKNSNRVRMKTKIKGLEAVEYFPTYNGTFTTFKFPIQSVECVEIASKKQFAEDKDREEKINTSDSVNPSNRKSERGDGGQDKKCF